MSGRKLRSFVKNLGGNKEKSEEIFSKSEKLTRSPISKLPESEDSKEEPIYANVSFSDSELPLATDLPNSTPEELYQKIEEALQIKLPSENHSSSNNTSNSSLNTNERDLIEIMADFDSSEFKDLIPKFNGKTEDLRRFISLVEKYNSSLEAGQRAILLNRLGFKLEGKAFEVYDKRVYRDWAELQAALEHKFSSQKSMPTLLTEMSRIQQHFNEPVDDFAYRIKEILQELKRATASLYNNEQSRTDFYTEHSRAALRVFKEGLNEPLRSLLKSSRVNDLDEAIDLAIEEEPYVYRDKYARKNNDSMAKFSPKKEHIKQEKLNCNRCGRSGHTVSGCFANISRWPKQVKEEPNLCSYCNKAGHKKDSCFAFLKNNDSENAPRTYKNPFSKPFVNSPMKREDYNKNAAQNTKNVRKTNFDKRRADCIRVEGENSDCNCTINPNQKNCATDSVEMGTAHMSSSVKNANH